MKTLSVVVPMYNEEEMIPLFFEKMNDIFSKITNYNCEYVLVNDGSKDKTLELLKEYKTKQDNIHIVSFSRNFGQEPAVAAGVKYATGDLVIVMDCDFQDPPELIFDLLKKYEEGYLVVNAHRVDRSSDSFLKRFTAESFYKVIYKLSGKIKVPNNVGNYRLIDRKVVDEINALTEKNRIFRVEVPYVGHKTTTVDFVRAPRPKGETKYNYKSMFNLAEDFIASSSVEPLKFSFKFGIACTFINLILLIASIVLFIVNENVHFYAQGTLLFLALMIIFSIFFALGIACIFIGINGMYLARINKESIDRPAYIVDEYLK